MSQTENLHGKDAISKIKELAEKVHICMLATELSKTPIAARPMSITKVEEDGTLWIFSKKGSEPNTQIQADKRVQLFFSNTGSSEYLSLYGEAQISTDKQKIEELWSPMIKAWFTEGKEDPTISLLKITPSEGYYWDTKNNKVIQLAKIAFGAIVGKPTDDGLQGKVSL